MKKNSDKYLSLKRQQERYGNQNLKVGKGTENWWNELPPIVTLRNRVVRRPSQMISLGENFSVNQVAYTAFTRIGLTAEKKCATQMRDCARNPPENRWVQPISGDAWDTCRRTMSFNYPEVRYPAPFRPTGVRLMSNFFDNLVFSIEPLLTSPL